jgi:hypothetical protein
LDGHKSILLKFELLLKTQFLFIGNQITFLVYQPTKS